MLGSALVRDPKFHDRVVAAARALLSTTPKLNWQAGPIGISPAKSASVELFKVLSPLGWNASRAHG